MTDFGWSYPAGVTSTPYDEEDTRWLDDLADELERRNEGRNLECWPLGSFGWKDADLDPEGCTGIAAIAEWDEVSVTVAVGGHKTICPPEGEEDEDLQAEITECQFNLVCEAGWNADWTGDDWCLHFKEEVRVMIPGEIWNEDDKTAIQKIASLVIDAALEACKPFERDMAQLHKDCDDVEEEIRKNSPRT